MTSGIIEILLDNAILTELVGDYQGKAKIFPYVRPEEVKQPYIVVSKTGNGTQSQGKEIDSRLDYPTYDILCYAKNFRLTEQLHEAVRNTIDNMSSVTEVCEFRRIWLITDRDGFNNDAQLYVHVATYGAEQVRPVYT